MKWSTPQCPVNDEQRVWLENAGAWLLKEFNIQLDQVTIVLPTPEFFPDTYRGQEDDAKKLLHRVCSYMKVSPDRLSLEWITDEHQELRAHLPSFEASNKGAAGHYQEDGGTIRISLSSAHLRDPMSLVAVMAHELGHVLLLGDKKIARDRKDHEYLTDLLTVLLGLGIFTANSAFRFTQWTGGFKQGWRAQRLGYLTEAMFGYALALFAWTRGESKPAWSKYLEGSIQHHFKSGLSYLKTRALANPLGNSSPLDQHRKG
jgi:hypothetical protein